MIKFLKSIGLVSIIGLLLVLLINGVLSPGSSETELPITSEEDFDEEIIPSTQPEVEFTPVIPDDAISVKDFGAKGDGLTDDTKAFQKAINEASAKRKTLLIPESNTAYLILSTLELNSNTHILGYGAALFMPSHRQVQNIFSASSKIEISNVSIEGLTLLSENDQSGTGEYEGSLTSHIQGIYLFGITNLVLKDVQMENMYIGIKLDASKEGEKSDNIIIDNLEIYNTRTPLFITSTTKLKMTNSILDASGGSTKFLHSAYIRGDTKDIEFSKVQFINSPGGGVHIFNSNTEMAPPENIRIIDSRIENTKVGIYIYSGAKDILVTNLVMKNIELPFKINNATRVNIENVEISNNPQVIKAVGLFNMTKISDSSINKIKFDGVGMTGYLFDIGSEVTDLLISEMMVTHLHNVGLVYGTSETFQNLVIENSKFEWSSVKWPLLYFNSIGSYVVIRDNKFINTGEKASRIVFNTRDTNVFDENNYYIGF